MCAVGASCRFVFDRSATIPYSERPFEAPVLVNQQWGAGRRLVAEIFSSRKFQHRFCVWGEWVCRGVGSVVPLEGPRCDHSTSQILLICKYYNIRLLAVNRDRLRSLEIFCESTHARRTSLKKDISSSTGFLLLCQCWAGTCVRDLLQAGRAGHVPPAQLEEDLLHMSPPSIGNRLSTSPPSDRLSYTLCRTMINFDLGPTVSFWSGGFIDIETVERIGVAVGSPVGSPCRFVFDRSGHFLTFL